MLAHERCVLGALLRHLRKLDPGRLCALSAAAGRGEDARRVLDGD